MGILSFLLLVTASLIGMAAYSASMIAAILVNLIVYEKNIDTHNLKVLIGAFCASFLFNRFIAKNYTYKISTD